MGNYTLRLWKGDYIGLGGGEIGFYGKDFGDWGHSLTRLEMVLYGIVGTEIKVFNSKTGGLIASRAELARFWTTVFSMSENPGKENLYTENRFIFFTEKGAENFERKANEAIKKAMKYPHNRNEEFEIYREGKNVYILWGRDKQGDQ